jgi:matrixin
MGRMKRARTPPAALLLLAALAAGCGGGSNPAAPRTPVPTPSPSSGPAPAPLAVDGLTGGPVAAAIAPAAPRLGDRVTATAAGFLPREQLFERAEIFLWPGELDYVHDTAYWEFTDGSFRLIRWSSGFTITLEGELAADPVLVRKAQEVAAEASRHIGYPISVGPGGTVTVTVDPTLDDEDAVAEADLRTVGAGITGAVISFRRRAEIAGGPQAVYTNTFLHELGHVIGLGHSPDDKDVMTPAEGRGTFEATYQPGEAGCLRMIYAHRRAGNLFPDRDPALAGAGVAQLRHPVIRD